MADEYRATSDPNVVERTAVMEYDLQDMIDTYIALKAEWDNRPVRKTVPDQETLDFWLTTFDQEDAYIRNNIKKGAQKLYDQVKPVYDAGLLPIAYDAQYFQLETFVTT